METERQESDEVTLSPREEVAGRVSIWSSLAEVSLLTDWSRGLSLAVEMLWSLRKLRGTQG